MDLLVALFAAAAIVAATLLTLGAGGVVRFPPRLSILLLCLFPSPGRVSDDALGGDLGIVA
jgi:hypothetical protein